MERPFASHFHNVQCEGHMAADSGGQRVNCYWCVCVFSQTHFSNTALRRWTRIRTPAVCESSLSSSPLSLAPAGIARPSSPRLSSLSLSLFPLIHYSPCSALFISSWESHRAHRLSVPSAAPSQSLVNIKGMLVQPLRLSLPVPLTSLPNAAAVSHAFSFTPLHNCPPIPLPPQPPLLPSLSSFPFSLSKLPFKC